LNKILKDKVVVYATLGLMFAIVFFMWRRQESLTKQIKYQVELMQEQTEQVSSIMAEPIKKEVEYPSTEERGRRVETTTKTIRDGETITETTITQEPSVIERGGSLRLTDYKSLPYEVDTTEPTRLIWVNYAYRNRVTVGGATRVFGLLIGVGVDTSTRDGEVGLSMFIGKEI